MASITGHSAILTTTSNHLVTILSPALTHSLYFVTLFQRLLSTTTFFLIFRTYLLSLILLRQGYYVSQIMLLQSYYAAVLLSKQVLALANQTIKAGWKASEKYRYRIYWEVAGFMLGVGNGMVLLIFWPGWIFVGGGVWCFWQVMG